MCVSWGTSVGQHSVASICCVGKSLMNSDLMDSDLTTVYTCVEFDFGHVLVLDVQVAGPWLKFFHFLLRVDSLSCFVLFSPKQLLSLQRLGIREGKLCHAISISEQGPEVLVLFFQFTLLFTGCVRSLGCVL